MPLFPRVPRLSRGHAHHLEIGKGTKTLYTAQACFCNCILWLQASRGSKSQQRLALEGKTLRRARIHLWSGNP
jgi:hypothetical protein